MTLSTDVALRRTLEEFCACRDKVRELIGQSYASITEAEEVSNTFVSYGFPYDAKPRNSKEQVFRDLDSRFWTRLFEHTWLTTIMDAKAIAEFRRQLHEQKEVPPFTVDNIQATYLAMYQERDELFARGVYNVFRSVDRKAWRTNEKEKFALGPKLVLEFWFQRRYKGGIEVRYGSDDVINDIDRCFRVLGGLPYRAGAWRDAMNAHFAEQVQRGHAGLTEHPFENELFKVRGFSNGNAHVWFLRRDLLDKVNETIGAYCDGRAVPDAR